MSEPDSRWYPLDGSWHPSVAQRPSALHINIGSDSALCSRSLILNTDDGGYTTEEADAHDRELCAKCAIAAKAAAPWGGDVSAITHGGTDRGGKLCRCVHCGRESVCALMDDYYTRDDAKTGPLYCETCITLIVCHALPGEPK